MLVKKNESKSGQSYVAKIMEKLAFFMVQNKIGYLTRVICSIVKHGLIHLVVYVMFIIYLTFYRYTCIYLCPVELG